MFFLSFDSNSRNHKQNHINAVFQGNIEGGRTSLWIRAWLQEQLFILGCFLQGDAGKVLFVAILVLSTFCVGLKSAQIHSRVDQLWVQGTCELFINYVQSKKRRNHHDICDTVCIS